MITATASKPKIIVGAFHNHRWATKHEDAIAAVMLQTVRPRSKKKAGRQFGSKVLDAAHRKMMQRIKSVPAQLTSWTSREMYQKMFGVSESTARKDLNFLAAEGKLERRTTTTGCRAGGRRHLFRQNGIIHDQPFPDEGMFGGENTNQRLSRKRRALAIKTLTGWTSTKDYSARFDVTMYVARYDMKSMVREGLAEVREGWGPAPKGGSQRIKEYRVLAA